MADSLTSISGLSSGLDYRALVDQIISQERRPAVRLETLMSDDKKRLDALSRLETLVNNLKTASEDLRSGKAFEAYTATSLGNATSGKSLLTAVAAAGAAPGTYDVVVHSLAATQRTTAGVGQASASAALGYTGEFALQRPNGGAAVGTITVAATDSLTAVRDKINALNTGASPSRIQATIIAGGADGTDQRLVLTSTLAGEANGFELASTSGTALAQLGLDGAGASPPTTKGATDAVLDVNGVPVRRTTNTVADAIPNVTLTLTAADPTKTATVTVERLNDAVANSGKAFVDAYNAVLDFVSKEGAPTSTGPLKGDAMLRGLRGLLSSTLLASAATGPDDMKTLSAVGISTDKTGKLSLDASKFTTAFSDRLADVQALFADRAGAFKSLAASYTETGTGLIAGRKTSIDLATANRTSRVADIDSRLDAKKTALLAQYAKFEATIGRLKALNESMSAQFTGLTKSND